MAWFSNRDSMKSRDGEDDHPLRRLSQVLASNKKVEDTDPQEAEARIRNLSHGTKRDSG